MTQPAFPVSRTLDLDSIQPQTIHFEYFESIDAVVATPIWELKTEENVRTWFQQYETYYRANFQELVDTIFDLSYFHVGPGMGPVFGEYRAKVVEQFTRRSYRCHNEDDRAKTYMYTSAVKYNAEANDFPTFEEAVRALLHDRENPAESGSV